MIASLFFVSVVKDYLITENGCFQNGNSLKVVVRKFRHTTFLFNMTLPPISLIR
nr:MAG TPA: hypothetical protein [Caudoviricetes sp.]